MYHRRKHRGDPSPLLSPKFDRVKVVISSPEYPLYVRVDGRPPSRVIYRPGVEIDKVAVPEAIHYRSPPRRPPEDHRRAARRYGPWMPEIRVDSLPRPVDSVHVPHRHVHVELPIRLPKRRVRFDLPPKADEPQHTRRRRNSEDARRPSFSALKCPKPAALPRTPSVHHPMYRQPSIPDLYRQPLRHDLHHRGSIHRHVPRTPQNPTTMPRATLPTIHILSYALDHAPHTTDAQALLSRYLPPSTLHLYTIPAYKFMPPPEDLCRLYSGVNPVIQEHVMQDARARRAVRHAVQDLLDFQRQERRREKDGRSWKREVAISVCCHFGTHRSVGIAERIAEEVEEVVGKWGGKVRVVHVHRRRGVRDLW